MSSKSNKSSATEKLIIEYLVKQNRPYSTQDLLVNLEGKVGKTELSNTLEKLADSKKIIEKNYGNKKVFMALQNVDCTNLKSELRDLDEKIIVTKSDLTRLQNENTSMDNQLKGFENKVPISELKERINELKILINNDKDRLDDIKSSKVPIVSKEDRAKTQKEFEKFSKEWRKLKRIGTEMIASITENCNMKKDQLCEDLGVILDEHENVQPFK